MVTDPDLRSEIAAIRETLRHIEATLDRGHRESAARAAQLEGINLRLSRVEVVGASASDLPQRVHDNELANAVQDAVRLERSEVLGEMRRLVMTGGAVIGIVVSVISLGVTVYF